MGGDISINITIVGATATGKSTIVYKYTGRNYLTSRQHTKEMQPMTTIHSVKHKDNKYYELCIRDTCGASICDMRSYSLCSNADAIIICFDIHKPSTFERAKKWINHITHDKTSYPILLLIGTTRYPDTVLSQHAKHLEAEQCANKKNIYYQTICLSEQLEINNIFSTIIDAFTAPDQSQNILSSEALNKHNEKYERKQSDVSLHKISRSDHVDDNSDDIKERQAMKFEVLKPLQSNPEALKIKIILLGDSGVGKTTFRRRLETNSFDNDVLATIGVDCSCFSAVGKHRGFDVETLLMDPSGQEIFKNITKQYYRGCHGVILMCDITSIESWKNIKFWIEEVRNNCNDDIMMTLFCNKMDLMEKNKSGSNDGQCQEIIENAKQYSEMFNLKTYNISCKDGEYIKYVQKGFQDLVSDIIYDKQLYKRLKEEQGYQILKRLKGTFDKSESFISVDRRPFDVNKGTIKRTCNVCDK